jgi:XRE family transcriptional regulator, fatty acid utilization regulator
VGSRGLPFFMIRIDRAGQSSKRYAGASASPLVETDRRCPLWPLHNAFDRPRTLLKNLVEMEDGSRWFTLSRTVQPQSGRDGSIRAEFAVGLGLDAKLAAPLSAARGIDLANGEATPIGPGCRACTRPDCPQRSAPPAGRVLVFNERERGLTPFVWAGD